MAGMRVTDYELSNLILRIEQEKNIQVIDRVVELGALRDLLDAKQQLIIATTLLNKLALYRYHSSGCPWYASGGCDCGSDRWFAEAACWLK